MATTKKTKMKCAILPYLDAGSVVIVSRMSRGGNTIAALRRPGTHLESGDYLRGVGKDICSAIKALNRRLIAAKAKV